MCHQQTPGLARSRPASARHSLVQWHPKGRHDASHYVFHPLPFPLFDPLHSLRGREEPVFNDVAFNQRLVGIVDERLGGLGVVFLEEAVEVLAVGGDGNCLGHCVGADHGAGYAARGC